MRSYTFMESFRYTRNSFFEYFSEKRYRRILMISLFIAIIWIFADWKSGSLTVNYWDDLLCLLFGIIVERMIPWGKNN